MYAYILMLNEFQYNVFNLGDQSLKKNVANLPYLLRVI